MQENTLNVVIVATIHNRKALTFDCLESISEQQPYDNCQIKILIVDDGSTDGSADAISDKYPDIFIIQGDGSLFWGGGMDLAMRESRRLFDPDVIIWVNDDVRLLPDAISRLLSYLAKNSHAMAGLTVTDEATGDKPVYGGRRLNRWMLRAVPVYPANVPLDVDCLNGNLVAIPKAIFTKIGNVHGRAFRHAGGDFDYSLRAKKHGFSVVLLPGVGGRSLHDHTKPNNEKKIGVWNELHRLFSVKGVDPRSWWNFCVRYSYLGPLLFVWTFMKRVVLIVLLRRRVIVN